MAEILLVNPRKRKSSRRKKPMARKKRRSAAQRAATRKMIAANRRKRRGNPVTVRRRKKKVAKRRTPVSRRRAPQRRKRRRVTRRRGNPALNMRSIQNQLMEAGTGAVGALGLDVIQGYLPIPANLKTGLVGTGVKALLAIGMGVVASKVKIVRGATANKMVNGALTVVLHDELKKQVQNFAPGIQMGEYIDDDGLGYYGSGYPAGVMGEEYGGMGSYLPEISDMSMGMEQDGLGEYMQPDEYIENMAYT
jgi:hypothetical protein